MLKKWFKYLWPDAYIVFTQSPEGMNTTQYVVNGLEIEMIEENSFIFDKSSLSNECVEYIQEFLSTYPQTRFVFMTSALSCSCVPTCSKHDMADMDVDISIIKSICHDGFSSYISVMDLENDNLLFKPFQLDYNFSPFFIMHELRQDYNGTLLLGLHVQNRIYLAVYKNNRLLYADNIPISEGQKFDEEYEGEAENLEDMDADFDLDDLGDFDDEFDDLDDFEQDIENMEDDEDLEADEQTQSTNLQEDEDEDDLKEYDLHFYEALKNSIKKFYENEKAESDFVEHIQMIDTVALGDNIFDLIKDELFCEINVRHVDLHKECLKLAIKEDK